MYLEGCHIQGYLVRCGSKTDNVSMNAGNSMLIQYARISGASSSSPRSVTNMGERGRVMGIEILGLYALVIGVSVFVSRSITILQESRNGFECGGKRLFF